MEKAKNENKEVKFDIATVENYESKCSVPALRSKVGKILTADRKIEENKWVIAINVNNIMEEGLYKKDFHDSQEEFANWMDLDSSTISKYKKAVRFMVNVATPKYGYDMKTLRYSQAVRLAQLGNNFDKFVEFAKKKGFNDVFKLSVHKLEELAREYRESMMLKLENTVDAKKPEKAEVKKDEKAEELPSFTGRYDNVKVWFEIDGIQYKIPLSELKHYKEK